MRSVSALVRLVSRVPARVRIKLLAAFLTIELLLIAVAAVGLQVLSGVNQRTDEIIRLQRKIEAYRQVQHDTINQLYSVASVLLSSDEVTLASTLRQLNQFGYNVDRLQFVAKDEIDVLDRFRAGLRPVHQHRQANRRFDPRRPRRGGAGAASGTGRTTG